MAKRSGQKFIARNRAPRVQIEYDVELYGAEKKVQLPFVMGVLADLSGIGLDPAIVVPAAPTLAALWAAGAVADAVAPPDAEVLLDLGAERSSACVVGGGRCLFARTFAGGFAPVLRAVARELEVSEEEATALLAAGDGATAPPDPRAEPALRRALAPLLRDVRAVPESGGAR